MDQKPNAQTIYEQLRELIVSLRLMPGSRVTESQLANYFTVSRTPIRAALQRLETEGLLAIKAKQGCFIRNIDMVQISHYYDARVALELAVIDTIAGSNRLEELQQLANQWNPESLVFGIETSDDLKTAEENFHLDLAAISKNTVLTNYIADINDHIRIVRRLGFPDTQSVTDTYEEHYLICELLIHRDITQAKDEMTRHIRKSQDQASRVTLNQLYGSKNAIVLS